MGAGQNLLHQCVDSAARSDVNNTVGEQVPALFRGYSRKADHGVAAGFPRLLVSPQSI